MSASEIVRLACFCAVATSFPTSNALGGQVELQAGVSRLYVEPFAVKEGSERLREALLAELRNLRSISLAPSQSNADLVLGGGGEIWIKGYRSLNPRSGRQPSNGTPVYAGFLSVESRNSKGETLWSYLVTPGSASEDIARDLAKRIAKRFSESLERDRAPGRMATAPSATTNLKGAGATFPYPVYAKWFTNYRRENPDLEIAYDPVGSEAGVRRLLAGAADFGASDSPEAIREIAAGEEKKYLFVPSVVGAVAPIVNLPGFPDAIAFTPEALAGIYLGNITKWNDPVLKQANRGLRLPDLDIVVVHRADGSGTSYAWTDYLSKTSPEWKARVGSGLAPQWPTGRAATGNDGVAKLVKELGGSIGYVEYIYALQNHLSYGRVLNRHGEYVAASLESIAIAARQSVGMGDDLKSSIVDCPFAGAYPISSFTWFVVPAHIADGGKRSAIMAFLKWTLGPGQRQAAALGYSPLPKDVAARAETAVLGIH